MFVVSPKLWICAFEGWVSVRLWFFDTEYTLLSAHILILLTMLLLEPFPSKCKCRLCIPVLVGFLRLIMLG